MAKRSGLGKGLDALFLDNNTEDGAIATLKVSEIEPNKNQPRTAFDDEALRELADSIREHGVIQPLVVRPMEKGGYQIVAGERRWRASRMAGIGEVPAVIRELSDSQTLEIAIIENLQREDLNPVELARGYKALMEDYGMTQEMVADKLGKSRSSIANTVRLLALPDAVLEHIRAGKITLGHAKALLSLESPLIMEQMAERIVKGQILVRDVENYAKEYKKAKKEYFGEKEKPAADSAWGDSFYKEMEIALSEALGRKVRIQNQGKKAVMELEFYDKQDLMDMATRLTGIPPGQTEPATAI